MSFDTPQRPPKRVAWHPTPKTRAVPLDYIVAGCARCREFDDNFRQTGNYYAALNNDLDAAVIALELAREGSEEEFRLREEVGRLQRLVDEDGDLLVELTVTHGTHLRNAHGLQAEEGADWPDGSDADASDDEED